MVLFPPDLPLLFLPMCFAVAVVAGLIKGMVGFAMPMVMLSGLGFFLPPDWVLAGLILPTVVANGMQALRYGLRAAFVAVQAFWVFLLVGGLCLVLSAQMYRFLDERTLLVLIGVPICLFAGLQLFGVRLSLARPSRRMEIAVASVAGAIGGVSGVWGPPTVAYLTALGTAKEVQMRVQGVIYGLGALALFFAHLGSGVMRGETLPFSLALVVPAVLGMWVGTRLQDRFDVETFRRVTLAVLLIAGANLLRRGIWG